MRILVTGAAGFIGSHLVRRLTLDGHEVYAVDALIDSTYSADMKKVRWIYLQENFNAHYYLRDIRFDNLDDIIESVDVIVNEAGIPGLMLSWENFQLYSDCNLVAVAKLLESLKKYPKKRFIQVSTSSVYGLNAVGDEMSETNPISPYGVTKLAAEKLIHAYGKYLDLDYVILRYFSIFGPGQRPDMGYSIFIERILENKEISIFGDGNQIRSNTYIEDCINGTVLAIERGMSGETYNISGGEEVSVNKVLDVLHELTGIKPKVNYLPGRPGDQFRTSGNWNKAKNELEFVPRIDVRSGLREQVNSFRECRFF
jgi:UDP-glucuronate 4-epimerase